MYVARDEKVNENGPSRWCENRCQVAKKNNQTQDKSPQPESEQQFQIILAPKPLMENIESYNQFFEEVLDEFDLIIRNCAPKISKHFTKLTAVINENNQYDKQRC